MNCTEKFPCSQHQHSNVAPTVTPGRTDSKSTDLSRAQGGLGAGAASFVSLRNFLCCVSVRYSISTAAAVAVPNGGASERTNKRTRHEPPLIIFKRGEGEREGEGKGWSEEGRGAKKYFRACVSRNRRPCSRSPLRSSGGCADSHCTCLPVTRVR